MLSPSIKSPTPHSSLVTRIIAYEEGDLDGEAIVTLFQELIDSGMAWTLQGHYGRTAKTLLETGVCTPAEKGNHVHGSEL